MLTTWNSKSTNWLSFCGPEWYLWWILLTCIFPKMGHKGFFPGFFQTFELLVQGLSSLWLLFPKSDVLERVDMADCRPRADTGGGRGSLLLAQAQNVLPDLPGWLLPCALPGQLPLFHPHFSLKPSSAFLRFISLIPCSP